MNLIDGKAIAQSIRNEIKEQVALMKRQPRLDVIIVGEDHASKTYVANKERACKEVGITSVIHRLDEYKTEKQVIRYISDLNKNKEVDGILVQLPLPKHFSERKVLSQIKETKDVDGFHARNAGSLFLGEETLSPCTPTGCIELIKRTGISLAGKHAVVVGRSNIVGKPLALMLLQENCTVTIAHSKTTNLKEVCKTADILCVAVGRKHFVTADMVKPGAIVIDVGINRGEDGKLYGDVDFENVLPIASHITPVPGGVGPMTIAMLLKNVLRTRGKG